jgi:hypothetical protein
MVPESLAALIAFASLTFTCLAGALCGSIACVVLRLRWSAWIVLQDLVIAAVFFALAVLPIAVYEYYFRRSALDTPPWAFVVAGISGPVFRHILRFIWLHWKNGTASGKL